MCMCDNKSAENSKEDEDMEAVIDNRSVKSTEITFDTNKECRDFVKLINNPPEPNERVKRLMKKYNKNGGK